MILFDLKCGNDHTFEAWFRDGATFEAQAAQGEIACPLCADTSVEKAPMAPNIARAKGGGSGSAEQALQTLPPEAKRHLGEFRERLTALRKEIEKNSHYVGPKFAEEARKIHYGEVDHRNIHGEASNEEAREMSDEGIPFVVVPWISRGDS